LEYKIRGSYRSCYTKPSVEYWKECNPGKIAAIEWVCNKLKINGWSPVIVGITKYDGMYYEGDKLIIACDFTN